MFRLENVMVGQVQDSSYVSKRTGARVDQLNVLLIDALAGAIPCQMEKNGFVPAPGMVVSADIAGIRPVEFGQFGFQVAIANLREASGGLPADNVEPGSPKKK